MAGASGIYLWTVGYRDGYLIYAAGITRRPFRKRFREHTQAYLNGFYTVLDAAALQRGVRAEVWGEFWTNNPSAEKQVEYESRRDVILDAAREQLSAFRVFVAWINPTPRISEGRRRQS